MKKENHKIICKKDFQKNRNYAVWNLLDRIENKEQSHNGHNKHVTFNQKEEVKDPYKMIQHHGIRDYKNYQQKM